MAKRYGLVIDLERCIGCNTCTIACKVENNMEIGSGIVVETIGGPHRDTPGGKFPKLSMYYLPMPCMHCDQPPCLDACPVEAIYKRGDGMVLIDKDKCDGCQACLPACPYDALSYDAKGNLAQKCNLCAYRIDQGLEPFCVRCCETEAIFFGDLNDPGSKVSQLIAQRNAYTLKSELGTKPAIYYCQPASRGQI